MSNKVLVWEIEFPKDKMHWMLAVPDDAEDIADSQALDLVMEWLRSYVKANMKRTTNEPVTLPL